MTSRAAGVQTLENPKCFRTVAHVQPRRYLVNKLVYTWRTLPYLALAHHVMGASTKSRAKPIRTEVSSWKLWSRKPLALHGWLVSYPQLLPDSFPAHRRGRNIDPLNFSDDKSEVMSSIPGTLGTLGTLGRPSWDELQLVQQRCSAKERAGPWFSGCSWGIMIGYSCKMGDKLHELYHESYIKPMKCVRNPDETLPPCMFFHVEIILNNGCLHLLRRIVISILLRHWVVQNFDLGTWPYRPLGSRPLQVVMSVLVCGVQAFAGIWRGHWFTNSRCRKQVALFGSQWFAREIVMKNIAQDLAPQLTLRFGRLKLQLCSFKIEISFGFGLSFDNVNAPSARIKRWI